MNKEQIILGMKIYSQNGIDFILGEEEQKILLEHIDKLEHNWNELKRVLNGLLEDENDFYSVMRIRDLLKIIKQLEEGGNNENN